jgi:hypothetical protein
MGKHSVKQRLEGSSQEPYRQGQGPLGELVIDVMKGQAVKACVPQTRSSLQLWI